MFAEHAGGQSGGVGDILAVAQFLQVLVEPGQGCERLALGIGKFDEALAQGIQCLVLAAQLSDQGINIVLQGLTLVVRQVAFGRFRRGQGGGFAKGLAKQMGQCFRSGYLTIQIALQLLQVFCLLLFFLLELLQGLAGGFTGSNAIGLCRGGQGQKNDSSTEP